jgi:hypothetical protein
MPKLTIDLIPKSCWYSNVRSNVSKEVWDRLRRNSYRKANYRCEICDGVGAQHPVECHEVWVFNKQKKTQKLKKLISLCPACHEVKHFGRTEKIGKRLQALNHLCKINNWTKEEADAYISKVAREWEQRSRLTWKLDTSWLNENGLVDN